ncbi:type 11 methyltransferase [[Clostridium] cellulosi]|jgi:Methyltransferase domain.|uniref:Type 11 methyltransferase n=1 Tax=[Clostridium] cellulosi TaxID=29343 RepID=A0A078KKA2_9FIRM|nr:type 11 methyltransferase [[Clostridium] cellulosi]
MKSYSVFAKYYDVLMKDVDYKSRTDYLCEIFKKHSLCGNSILDLGCGTGAITFELVKKGYDVIGVDQSEQMLSQAAEKSNGISNNPIFICQDMRNLDLYGTVSAAVCVLDGINHLTSAASVKAAFSRIALFLEKGGLFVFDLNTPFKMETILGNNAFVYDYDDIFCVWQNFYNKKTRLCNFELTFFEYDSGHYNRFDESFSERAYTTRQIKSWLFESGLSLEAVYDDLSFDNPKDNSERLIYVARKI